MNTDTVDSNRHDHYDHSLPCVPGTAVRASFAIPVGITYHRGMGVPPWLEDGLPSVLSVDRCSGLILHRMVVPCVEVRSRRCQQVSSLHSGQWSFHLRRSGSQQVSVGDCSAASTDSRGQVGEVGGLPSSGWESGGSQGGSRQGRRDGDDNSVRNPLPHPPG